MADLSYCAQEVRRHDRDRFLTALFAPERRREDLLALYAFNLEIAKTAEVVSEPMLGRIRLQWWREGIDGLFAGTPRSHPVLAALQPAVREGRIPRTLLEALVDGRELDLEAEPPATLDALEAYAEATSARLLEAASAVLGAEEREVRTAARQVGVAWALVGLVRALPFHLRRRRLMLPLDHLAVAGVDQADLFELRGSEGLSGIVMRLCGRAADRLQAGREAGAPGAARPALALGVLADAYLRRIERAGHDPFDPGIAQPLPAAGWLLAWASLRGRY